MSEQQNPMPQQSLQDYSRQQIVVGIPAHYLFSPKGAKIERELVLLGATLRQAEAMERIANALEQPKQALGKTQPFRRLVVKEEIKHGKEEEAFRHLITKTNADIRWVEREYSMPHGPTPIEILKEEKFGPTMTTFSLAFAGAMDVYLFGLSWAAERTKCKEGASDE